MSVRIFSVTPGSPADKAGIRADERIKAINGEPITDEIDYQALSQTGHLTIEIENTGSVRKIRVKKTGMGTAGTLS